MTKRAAYPEVDKVKPIAKNLYARLINLGSHLENLGHYPNAPEAWWEDVIERMDRLSADLKTGIVKAKEEEAYTYGILTEKKILWDKINHANTKCNACFDTIDLIEDHPELQKALTAIMDEESDIECENESRLELLQDSPRTYWEKYLKPLYLADPEKFRETHMKKTT